MEERNKHIPFTNIMSLFTIGVICRHCGTAQFFEGPEGLPTSTQNNFFWVEAQLIFGGTQLLYFSFLGKEKEKG
jgi:hypothetical protein